MKFNKILSGFLITAIGSTCALPNSLDKPRKFSSKIIPNQEQFLSLINDHLSEIIGNNDPFYYEKNMKWDLLFRASEHNFRAPEFHRLCDNEGETITLVKAKNNNLVVAAYNDNKWFPEENDEYTMTPNEYGFIAAIDYETNENESNEHEVNGNFEIKTFYRKQDRGRTSDQRGVPISDKFGTISKNEFGPSFGEQVNGDSDLHIGDKCDQVLSSVAMIEGLYVGEKHATPYPLFGTRDFLVEEYEVYRFKAVEIV